MVRMGEHCSSESCHSEVKPKNLCCGFQFFFVNLSTIVPMVPLPLGKGGF